MLFWSHPFDKLHIAMSNVLRRWVNSRCCPHIHIACVCVCMYISFFFYVLFILSGFLIFCLFLFVNYMAVALHWTCVLAFFTRTHFLTVQFFVQRLEYLNFFCVCPVFWIQMYRKIHLCWRSPLAVIFSFHLSIVCMFSLTLRDMAGIAGIY